MQSVEIAQRFNPKLASVKNVADVGDKPETSRDDAMFRHAVAKMVLYALQPSQLLRSLLPPSRYFCRAVACIPKHLIGPW